MKKTLSVVIFLLAFGYFSAKNARASEGTAFLESQQNSAQCFTASVLVDEGEYRLVMTCRNLIIPPQTETLYYHAWAKKAKAAATFLSLGDISGGKLFARVRDAFDEVFITAESESNPRTPNLENITVSGTVRPISFSSADSRSEAESSQDIARITVAPTPHPTPSDGGQQRNAATTAFRVFLIVLGAIISVAIVISIIQRRSASRS